MWLYFLRAGRYGVRLDWQIVERMVAFERMKEIHMYLGKNPNLELGHSGWYDLLTSGGPGHISGCYSGMVVASGMGEVIRLQWSAHDWSRTVNPMPYWQVNMYDRNAAAKRQGVRRGAGHSPKKNFLRGIAYILQCLLLRACSGVLLCGGWAGSIYIWCWRFHCQWSIDSKR